MTGIAIVGRGAMGTRHARALASLGRAADIRYVVARSPGPPLEAAPTALVIDDFNRVLRDDAVDVVAICTPTGTHRQLAVQALRAGKNVLLEKPIALTMADAREIAQEAHRAEGIVMVAHVVRFFEGYRLVRRDVAAGLLGEVLSARATRLSSAPDWADWLRNDAESGGMLVDFGIHDCDQVNLLLGRPLEVSAVQAVPGGPVESTIRYEGGRVGQVLSFSGLAPQVPFRSSIEIVGSHGVARYEFVAASHDRAEVSRYSLSTGDTAVSLDLAPEDPYATQYEYFLQCVATHAQPVECTTPEAIDALQVALAATRSRDSRRPVRVESHTSN
ncbi:Gfo/Idh/MocA family oxidoreductase [Rhodoglobus sp. NPDC076762]